MISPQNSLSVSRSMYFSVWQAAFACSAWSRLVSCHKQFRLTTRSTLHTSHVLQCVAGRLRMQRLVSSRLLSQTVQTDNTVYSTHQSCISVCGRPPSHAAPGLVSCHKQSRLTTRSTLHTSHVLQCVAGRLRMQRLVSSHLLSQTVQTDNTVYSTHQNTAQYTPLQN